jgi:hypothetical protein
MCFDAIDQLTKIGEDFTAKNGANFGNEGVSQFSKVSHFNGNASNTLSQQVLGLYSRVHAKRSDFTKLTKKNKHDRTYFEKQISKLQARIALFKTSYNNPEDDARSEQMRQENECKQSILEVENGDL